MSSEREAYKAWRDDYAKRYSHAFLDGDDVEASDAWHAACEWMRSQQGGQAPSQPSAADELERQYASWLQVNGNAYAQRLQEIVVQSLALARELEAQLAARDEQLRRVREVLERYGHHDPGKCRRSMHSEWPCTCGLEAALTDAQLAESERAVCTALGLPDTENINDALIEIDSLREKLARQDEQIAELTDRISNDAYAFGFQTFGQYRTWLLEALTDAQPTSKGEQPCE